MAKAAGGDVDVGDDAPYFVGRTNFGEPVSLWDYRGKYLVLYFFTKAYTPGCTKQARIFRDNYPEIQALGGEVLGVSLDDFETQCDFASRNAVTFPLISDKDRRISEAYGAVRSLLPFDKRITLIISPEGKILYRFQHQFQVSKHLDDVLTFLRSLPQAVSQAAG